MEWADLTEEYTSGLLNTDSLLSPDALAGATSAMGAASEADPSATQFPVAGESATEISQAD